MQCDETNLRILSQTESFGPFESNVVTRFAHGGSLELGAGFRRCYDIMPVFPRRYSALSFGSNLSSESFHGDLC
jgi:hypothetical protein